MDTNTLNGWHKGLPPERTSVNSGLRAQEAYAMCLELETERQRVRTQGPAPKPFKQLPTPLKAKS